MREYDTSIKILGGIPNLNVIIETIRHYSIYDDMDETKKKFVEENAFGFNITSSRQRFFRVIEKLFLENSEAKDKRFFINSIANDKPTSFFKKALLYLEIYRQNALFYDITRKLVYVKYHDNRRLISPQEILDFLLDYEEGTKIGDYSEGTLKNIPTKYMSFMKKLDYFKENEDNQRLIAYPRPGTELITYIIYLLKAEDKTDHETYNSDLFEAFMLEERDKIELLKKGSMAGYYNFNQAGDGTASFSLNYDQEEIIDELFE